MSPGIYLNAAGALQSGFEVTVETPRGAVHNLRFEARHRNGLWREIFNRRIVVSHNAGGSYEDWMRSYDTLQWGDPSRIGSRSRLSASSPDSPSCFRLSAQLPVT